VRKFKYTRSISQCSEYLKLIPMKNILFILLFLFISSCSSWDEVSRVSSPNGLVDAVLIESNGGATTSFNYHIFLEREKFFGVEQIKIGNLYGAIRSKNAYGINLKWLNSTTIQLEYLRAKEIRLQLNNVDIQGVTYSIEFHSGVEDTQAPAGGMLYNLRNIHLAN